MIELDISSVVPQLNVSNRISGLIKQLPVLDALIAEVDRIVITLSGIPRMRCEQGHKLTEAAEHPINMWTLMFLLE